MSDNRKYSGWPAPAPRNADEKPGRKVKQEPAPAESGTGAGAG